ncbi:glycosyltransferase family 2 protein [Siccirubricoccus phaeus]|uniref:glycosyltransferase family 2 protein n=1 Tax=Siccirubricoccus phaeus TaxID=2595053 RepID=UPI00165CA974|nr:glycosyltransferase family 2 protein [Siccirubricoccus phaeus]
MRIFALTFAHNEDFMLRRWVEYHGRQLGQENLFVVDHGSTDLSTAGLGRANILRVPRVNYDERGRVIAASKLHEGLLQYFDCGFVCDVDEFLVADPRHHPGGLAGFIAAVRPDSLCGIGLELLHIPQREPAFQPHLPILVQRRHVFYNAAVSKHCFARIPTRFGGGLHSSTNPIRFHEHFYLFHLKHFDQPWRLQRQRVTRGWDYATEFGDHARRSDAEAEHHVAGLVQHFGQHLEPGFGFAAETARSVALGQRVANGEYVQREYFYSEAARLVPAEFSTLF